MLANCSSLNGVATTSRFARCGAGATVRDDGREVAMPRRSPALLIVHVVWATSRRRRVLSPSLERRLVAMLSEKAFTLRSLILAAGCASDHIHIVVRLASSTSLGELVRHLKGASAYELNHDGSFGCHFAWQEGYWAESVSPADLDPIVHYVRHQRERHDESHPAERWKAANKEHSPPPKRGGL